MFDDFDDSETNGDDFFSRTDMKESLNKFNRIDAGDSVYFTEEEIESLSNHFFVANRFADQMKIIEHGLYLYPNKVDFLLDKATMLAMDNRHKDALEVVLTALKFEPYNPSVHKMQGEIYCDLEKYDEAEHCFLSALEHAEFEDEEFVADIYVNYAQMLCEQQNMNRAMDLMEVALRKFPDNETLFNQLSMNFISSRKYESAIQYFKKLIDEQPYSYLSWYQLGRFYELTNRKELARSAYEYSGLANKDSKNAWFSLGSIYEGREEFREAIENYRLSLREKGDLYPYVCIARCYLGLEDGEMARSYLKKASAIEDALPEYTYLLGYSYLTEKQALKALPYFRRIYKNDKNDFPALKGILSCYVMLNRLDEIETFYYRLKKENPALVGDHWKEFASILYLSECDTSLEDLLITVQENDDDREALGLVESLIRYNQQPVRSLKDKIISSLIDDFEDTLESIRLFIPELQEDEEIKKTIEICENDQYNEQGDI